ncbi:MAG: adenylate/guanylate cyclase domain-containing protein [Leptospirales bacterium]|nr:adenylate/guanylate cyclase domain-containing protein [Leptospirales bacterium]
MRVPFALKIGGAMSILALFISGASVFFIYTQARELTLTLIGSRLKDLGGAGVYLFTPEDRRQLKLLRDEIYAQGRYAELGQQIEKLGEEDKLPVLDQARQDSLMASAGFQHIVQLLRQVRQGSDRHLRPYGELPIREEILAQAGRSNRKAPSVAYAYIYVPAPGELGKKYIIYVADGDYLPYDANHDGDFEDEADYEGNPTGNLVLRPTAEMQQAYDNRQPVAGREWDTDAWGTWLSGYVPILDEDGSVIAVLGMDYDVRSEANKVAFIRNMSIGVVVVALLLAVALSMLLARWITRPVNALASGAERVAQRDFSTQVVVSSSDELGVLAGAFNNMVGEIREYSQNMEALNSAFERFVPKEFLQQIGQENVVGVRLGDQVQREMTILFSDIRSFTTLSEAMTPKENFDFLNGYLGRVSPLIRSNHGFIDKYIGDAIMALFPRRVDDAVENAIQMLAQVADYNARRAEQGQAAIRIGVGLHTGNLMLGTIGEERRMEGTVISDAVNLASRLEGLTKNFGASILISESSLQKLNNPAGVLSRCLGKVRVKGKTEPVLVYEIYNGDSAEQIDLKNAALGPFSEALALFQRGKLGDAGLVFQEILGKNPADRAAAAYLQRCQRRAVLS